MNEKLIKELFIATAKADFLHLLYRIMNLSFDQIYEFAQTNYLSRFDTFNLERFEDGTAQFDFQFESLNGTIYLNKDGWDIGKTFDIFFGEFCAPVATANIYLQDGKVIYEELPTR